MTSWPHRASASSLHPTVCSPRDGKTTPLCPWPVEPRPAPGHQQLSWGMPQVTAPVHRPKQTLDSWGSLLPALGHMRLSAPVCMSSLRSCLFWVLRAKRRAARQRRSARTPESDLIQSPARAGGALSCKKLHVFIHRTGAPISQCSVHHVAQGTSAVVKPPLCGAHRLYD